MDTWGGALADRARATPQDRIADTAIPLRESPISRIGEEHSSLLAPMTVTITITFADLKAAL